MREMSVGLGGDDPSPLCRDECGHVAPSGVVLLAHRNHARELRDTSTRKRVFVFDEEFLHLHGKHFGDQPGNVVFLPGHDRINPHHVDGVSLSQLAGLEHLPPSGLLATLTIFA